MNEVANKPVGGMIGAMASTVVVPETASKEGSPSKKTKVRRLRKGSGGSSEAPEDTLQKGSMTRRGSLLQEKVAASGSSASDSDKAGTDAGNLGDSTTGQNADGSTTHDVRPSSATGTSTQPVSQIPQTPQPVPQLVASNVPVPVTPSSDYGDVTYRNRVDMNRDMLSRRHTERSNANNYRHTVGYNDYGKARQAASQLSDSVNRGVSVAEDMANHAHMKAAALNMFDHSLRTEEQDTHIINMANAIHRMIINIGSYGVKRGDVHDFCALLIDSMEKSDRKRMMAIRKDIDNNELYCSSMSSACRDMYHSEHHRRISDVIYENIGDGEIDEDDKMLIREVERLDSRMMELAEGNHDGVLSQVSDLINRYSRTSENPMETLDNIVKHLSDMLPETIIGSKSGSVVRVSSKASSADHIEHVIIADEPTKLSKARLDNRNERLVRNGEGLLDDSHTQDATIEQVTEIISDALRVNNNFIYGLLASSSYQGEPLDFSTENINNFKVVANVSELQKGQFSVHFTIFRQCQDGRYDTLHSVPTILHLVNNANVASLVYDNIVAAAVDYFSNKAYSTPADRSAARQASAVFTCYNRPNNSTANPFSTANTANRLINAVNETNLNDSVLLRSAATLQNQLDVKALLTDFCISTSAIVLNSKDFVPIKRAAASTNPALLKRVITVLGTTSVPNEQTADELNIDAQLRTDSFKGYKLSTHRMMGRSMPDLISNIEGRYGHDVSRELIEKNILYDRIDDPNKQSIILNSRCCRSGSAYHNQASFAPYILKRCAIRDASNAMSKLVREKVADSTGLGNKLKNMLSSIAGMFSGNTSDVNFHDELAHKFFMKYMKVMIDLISTRTAYENYSTAQTQDHVLRSSFEDMFNTVATRSMATVSGIMPSYQDTAMTTDMLYSQKAYQMRSCPPSSIYDAYTVAGNKGIYFDVECGIGKFMEDKSIDHTRRGESNNWDQMTATLSSDPSCDQYNMIDSSPVSIDDGEHIGNFALGAIQRADTVRKGYKYEQERINAIYRQVHQKFKQFRTVSYVVLTPGSALDQALKETSNITIEDIQASLKQYKISLQDDQLHNLIIGLAYCDEGDHNAVGTTLISKVTPVLLAGAAVAVRNADEHDGACISAGEASNSYQMNAAKNFILMMRENESGAYKRHTMNDCYDVNEGIVDCMKAHYEDAEKYINDLNSAYGFSSPLHGCVASSAPSPVGTAAMAAEPSPVYGAEAMHKNEVMNAGIKSQLPEAAQKHYDDIQRLRNNIIDLKDIIATTAAGLDLQMLNLESLRGNVLDGKDEDVEAIADKYVKDHPNDQNGKKLSRKVIDEFKKLLRNDIAFHLKEYIDNTIDTSMHMVGIVDDLERGSTQYISDIYSVEEEDPDAITGRYRFINTSMTDYLRDVYRKFKDFLANDKSIRVDYDSMELYRIHPDRNQDISADNIMVDTYNTYNSDTLQPILDKAISNANNGVVTAVTSKVMSNASQHIADRSLVFTPTRSRVSSSLWQSEDSKLPPELIELRDQLQDLSPKQQTATTSASPRRSLKKKTTRRIPLSLSRPSLDAVNKMVSSYTNHANFIDNDLKRIQILMNNDSVYRECVEYVIESIKLYKSMNDECMQRLTRNKAYLKQYGIKTTELDSMLSSNKKELNALETKANSMMKKVETAEKADQSRIQKSKSPSKSSRQSKEQSRQSREQPEREPEGTLSRSGSEGLSEDEPMSRRLSRQSESEQGWSEDEPTSRQLSRQGSRHSEIEQGLNEEEERFRQLREPSELTAQQDSPGQGPVRELTAQQDSLGRPVLRRSTEIDNDVGSPTESIDITDDEATSSENEGSDVSIVETKIAPKSKGLLSSIGSVFAPIANIFGSSEAKPSQPDPVRRPSQPALHQPAIVGDNDNNDYYTPTAGSPIPVGSPDHTRNTPVSLQANTQGVQQRPLSRTPSDSQQQLSRLGRADSQQRPMSPNRQPGASATTVGNAIRAVGGAAATALPVIRAGMSNVPNVQMAGMMSSIPSVQIATPHQDNVGKQGRFNKPKPHHRPLSSRNLAPATAIERKQDSERMLVAPAGHHTPSNIAI